MPRSPRQGSRVGPALAGLLLLGSACARAPVPECALVVTATAYNSLPGQGSGDPAVAAWGDRLRPGMRAIAVSRDLVALGLGRGERVRIEGLPGEYEVLDAMPSGWTRRIDVYMGTDVDAARRWGRRSVRLSWSSPTCDRGAASVGRAVIPWIAPRRSARAA
jgi:3D (Asp-Asp-Asp) domain-containing protein